MAKKKIAKAYFDRVVHDYERNARKEYDEGNLQEYRKLQNGLRKFLNTYEPEKK